MPIASRTWWSGAVTGAAFATTAACAILLFQSHHVRPSAPPPTPAAQTIGVPAAVPVSETTARPCAPAPMLRAHTATRTAPAPDTSITIARGAAPEHSRPLVQLGLTPEERALVRLTRIADPRQLATLNPETHAKLEAEDAAAFEKFFTPPPRPKIDQEPAPSQAPGANPGTEAAHPVDTVPVPQTTPNQNNTDSKGQP